MIKHIENLYEQLSVELKDIETNSTLAEFERRKQSLSCLHEKILELKEMVINNSFLSQEDEISFFKYIKPKFISRLIYFSIIDLIELRKPVGTVKDLKKYYRRELSQINFFFNHHIEYYHYYRSCSTALDETFFLRGRFDLPKSFTLAIVDVDPRFSTGPDYVIALIKANEQLKVYLNRKLKELNKSSPSESMESRKILSWTGPKVNLIELAYGLFETGQINNGGADVNSIAEALEHFFNVKLGVIYRPFQEIRMRKRESRTKYIDMMKDGLIRRMDDLDSM